MGLDWKKAFKVEPADVLGMDIGSARVKLVELRKEASRYTLTAAGIAEIPGSAEEHRQAEMNITEAVGACLRSAQPRSRLAVCGVSGPEVAVRGFKFPALPRDEIEGAVMLEAAQVCPFNIDEGSVDYQLMPDGDDSIRGVLVAATRKVIKAKTRVAGGADLACVLVDVDGLALLNCFAELESEAKTSTEDRRTTAILNVGSTYTTLAIGGSDGLPFVRDIVYGGNDIIEQIANRTGVSKETVGARLFGDEGGAAEPDLSESIRAACQKLATDVTDTLRYYNAQEKQGGPDKIHICGGFSLADGFVAALNGQLPAEAVLWNPFDKMRCSGGQGCEQLVRRKGPALAVAAGFAMRAI